MILCHRTESQLQGQQIQKAFLHVGAKLADYSKSAFRFDKDAGRRPVAQTSPSEKGPMGPELGRVMITDRDIH